MKVASKNTVYVKAARAYEADAANIDAGRISAKITAQTARLRAWSCWSAAKLGL